MRKLAISSKIYEMKKFARNKKYVACKFTDRFITPRVLFIEKKKILRNLNKIISKCEHTKLTAMDFISSMSSFTSFGEKSLSLYIFTSIKFITVLPQ